MNILGKLFFLLLLINLVSYLAPSSFTADEVRRPLQGHIKKKGKYKMGALTNTKIGNTKTDHIKAGNPYSVSKPYDPNNPPPIDNRIHPVSSNAH